MLLHDYLLSMDNIKWILKKGGVDNKEACYQQGYPRLFLLDCKGEKLILIYEVQKKVLALFIQKKTSTLCYSLLWCKEY